MGFTSGFVAAQDGEGTPADALTWVNLLCVYTGYGVLLLFGYIREYSNRLVGYTPFVTKKV